MVRQMGVSKYFNRSGEREFTGSIPGRDIPKSLQMVLTAPRLALKTNGVELGLVDPVSG